MGQAAEGVVRAAGTPPVPGTPSAEATGLLAGLESQSAAVATRLVGLESRFAEAAEIPQDAAVRGNLWAEGRGYPAGTPAEG